MNRVITAAAAAAMLALAGTAYAQHHNDQNMGSAASASADQTVAFVNGRPIKRSEIDLIVRELHQPDTPRLRAGIRDKLIELDVLMQEARHRRITDRESVRFQADNAARSVYIQALLRDEIAKHKPTEAQIQAEYDREVKLAGDKEYKVHHILVKTEQQAQDIIAQLNKGASFSALAKKDSLDPGSASNGGGLGWAPAAAYVRPFADAVTGLHKGQVSQTPVHTQFGWHVIRLDDERPIHNPSLDEVKSHIVQALEQREAQQFIASLKQKASVKIVSTNP